MGRLERTKGVNSSSQTRTIKSRHRRFQTMNYLATFKYIQHYIRHLWAAGKFYACIHPKTSTISARGTPGGSHASWEIWFLQCHPETAPRSPPSWTCPKCLPIEIFKRHPKEIPQAMSTGSSSRRSQDFPSGSPSQTCPECLPREVFRRQPKEIPKPPQPTLLPDCLGTF